jgi:DNA repair protein RadC
LNAKQHLIKVVTGSQGTVNESLAHPREIFKPVITHRPTALLWCIIYE